MLGLWFSMANRGCLWRDAGPAGRARSLNWCMWSPRKLECLYGGTLLNLLSTCQRSRMSSISRSHQKSLRARRAWTYHLAAAASGAQGLSTPSCTCAAPSAERNNMQPDAMLAGQQWQTRGACSPLHTARSTLGSMLHVFPACAQKHHCHAGAVCSRLHACRAALAKAWIRRAHHMFP